jgi:hypothetical protein
MQIDLKEVNKKLALKGKRTNQSIGAITPELKEAAGKVAKLKVKVSALEREVRRKRGAQASPKKIVGR